MEHLSTGQARADHQSPFAVTIEACLHGTFTRKVDGLVKALGADTGISKSEVSQSDTWPATGGPIQHAPSRRDRSCDMPELIPLPVLFGNPERVSPRLSPDGAQLAWIAPHEGVLNVWIAPIGPAGVDLSAAAVVTDDNDRDIRGFAWAHDRPSPALLAGHRRR